MYLGGNLKICSFWDNEWFLGFGYKHTESFFGGGAAVKAARLCRFKSLTKNAADQILSALCTVFQTV